MRSTQLTWKVLLSALLPLAACQADQAGVVPTAGLAQAQDATLAITLQAPRDDRRYHTQFLQAVDWTRASATLTHADPTFQPPLTQSASVVLDGSGARTASFHFSALKPATGYTLTLQLQRPDTAAALQDVATGALAGFTVLPGPNNVAATVQPTASGQVVVVVPQPNLATTTDFRSVIYNEPYYCAKRVAGGVVGGSLPGTEPLSATFSSVDGLVVDGEHQVLYVADATAHAIRGVPLRAGPTFVKAGTPGLAGFAGDGGPASSALLDAPHGMIRSPGTNTFLICDSGNHRIRRISADNVILTEAGGGTDGSLTVANARNALLDRPWDIFSHDLAVFFTERGSGRVRRLDPDGSLITLATLTPGATGPIAYDATFKHLWVGEGDRVRLITGAAGTSPTLASAPVFTSKNVAVPEVTALTYDGFGNLYAAYAGGTPVGTRDGRIWQVPVDHTGVLRPGFQFKPELIAGKGPLHPGTQLTDPAEPPGTSPVEYAASTAGGNATQLLLAGVGTMKFDWKAASTPNGLHAALFVGNSYPGQWGQIVRLDASRAGFGPSGVVTTLAGTGGLWVSGSTDPINFADGLGSVAKFMFTFDTGPTNGGTIFTHDGGITMDDLGNMLVTDHGRIRQVAPYGNTSTLIGDGNSIVPGTPTHHAGYLARDQQGNLYSARGTMIEKITPSGTVTLYAGSSAHGFVDGLGSAARFDDITGLAIDLSGYLYVTDSNNTFNPQAIRKISPTPAGGLVTTLLQLPGRHPAKIALDQVGNLYAGGAGATELLRLSTDGELSVVVPAWGAPGVIQDGIGAAGHIGSINGLAVDAAGNVYVADGIGHAIRKVTPGGAVTTVAGALAIPGFADGMGSAAKFNKPTGLYMDACGTLYVIDSLNNRIRTIQ